MITFETNLFVCKPYSESHLVIDANRILHYKIYTNDKNSQWFIATTIAYKETGHAEVRNDLSKVKPTYPEILQYIAHIKQELLIPSEDPMVKERETEIEDLVALAKLLSQKIANFKVKYL